MHYQSTLPLETCEDVRRCEACGMPLVQRDKEVRSKFLKRRTCNRGCRSRLHAQYWARRRAEYLDAGIKSCTKCGETKPLDQFRKSPHHPDALLPKCTACEKQELRDRYWSDPEAARAYARVHARKNPKKVRARWKRWYAENRARQLQKYRAYNARRREQQREYDRRRRAAMPVELKRRKWREEYQRWKASGGYDRYMKEAKGRRQAYQREWRRVCRVKHVAKENRRRARIARVAVHDVDRLAVILRDGPTCYICDRHLSPHEITLDHVLPIARGGPHSESNLAVCCTPCNSRKRDRLPDELPMDIARRVRARIEQNGL